MTQEMIQNFLGEKHTKACTKAYQEFIAWKQNHPKYCKECNALGYTETTYDPSPAGVSLGSGYMVDREPCEYCLVKGICPVCGESALVLHESQFIDSIYTGPCSSCGWKEEDVSMPYFECSCWEIKADKWNLQNFEPGTFGRLTIGVDKGEGKSFNTPSLYFDFNKGMTQQPKPEMLDDSIEKKD